MKRAIQELPESDYLVEVSEGVDHVVEVTSRFDEAAHKLAEDGHHHASRVLGNHAEEEATKVLILLDAVRCPPRRQKFRSRTLSYFYSHLAKGIYAEVCGWSPIDFAEVQRGVDHLRVQHYLDGPLGVDWIFPNRIEQQREDLLYVGYVRDDSDGEGADERYWISPHNVGLIPYWTTSAIDLARSLHRVGATKPEGLAVVAEVWQPVNVLPEMRSDELHELNLHTLKLMDDRGLLTPDSDDACRKIMEQWSFPLWPLDLRLIKVDKNDLSKERRRWTPEDW